MEKMNQIINFSVYENGNEFIGIAKATLPEIKFLTQTVNGASIAGNIETVLQGMVDVMSMQLDYVKQTDDAVKLCTPVTHRIDLRVAMQGYDTLKAATKIEADKYVMEVVPKQFTGGSIAPASASDASGQYSVLSYKGYKDGKEIWNIDPMNYICRINGVDYLADVRKALGK